MPTHAGRQAGTVNSVFVVELLEGGLRTGRLLYDQTIKPVGGEQYGLHAEFLRLEHNSDLVPALDFLLNQCQSKSLKPILHIESHGSPTGIGRKGENVVPWSHFVPVLRELNRVSGFNLLVTMSTCHGASLATALDVAEPCPLLALVGTHEMVGEEALLRGYSAFYRSLFGEGDLDSAIDALANAEGWHPEAWQRYDARWYFAVTYGMFLASLSLSAAVDESARADNFKSYKRRFFMTDEFPSNRTRFALTEAECLALFRDSGMNAA